jgi:phosphatidylglycerol---prolipoprotein diacylglyceryl transferase
MYPELFSINGFVVNTYGVLLALAFLFALLVASRMGERAGLPRDKIYDLGLWMLIASLVGSKILMLFTEPVYRSSLSNLLSFDFLRSGGVFYGGFIAAVLTGFLLVRKFGLPWWNTADAFAPGVAIGQTIGRLGCFAAGCCWGKPTTCPWGVQFTERGNEVTGVPAGIDLHPTQLYEAGATLLIFLLLLFLSRRKRFNGQLILTYGLLYGMVRFVVEIFRDDPRGDVAGLTSLTGLSTSQMVSLIVFAVSLLLFTLLYRRSNTDKDRNVVTANVASA